MIGSNLFAGAMRGLGRNALDLPVAALAGVSAAFVAFAAPGDILSQLVGATGLPSVLPAAEPPLGLKARTGLGAAGAIAVFFAVYLLLRMLDRFGAKAHEEEEREVAAPRLRRRDFHPDAPSRRPLSAARDLGEPEFLAQDEPERTGVDLAPEGHPEWQPEPEADPAAQPLWLSPEPAQPAVYQDPWEQTEDETGPELELDEEFAGFEEFGPEAEPEPEAEPQPQSHWEPDVAPAAGPAYSREPELGAWREPEPQPEEECEPEHVSWREFEPEPESEPDPEPEPLPAPLARKPKRPVILATDEVAPRPVIQPTDEATPRPLIQAAAEPVPPPPVTNSACSIPELMERLERGLARRRYQTPIPAEPPQVFPESDREPADDRLQSAIDSLHRLASRQN